MRRETDANGRGGVEGWKAQWWDAATDAAAIAREVIDDETRTNEGSTTPGEERTENEGSTTPGSDGDGGGGGEESSSSSNVVGAYARGSVALGTAVASVSDVDVLVLRWAPAPPASSSRSSSRASARLLAETDARIRARLRGEWSARWGHLATKPDVRVLAAPRPPHPAGEALRKIVDAEKKQSSERDVDVGSRREEIETETSPGEPSRDVSREEDVERTSHFAALANVLGPGATFALAAEGATIFGPDLPRLAPSAWRKPPADGRCLDGLHADVVEALSDGGERARSGGRSSGACAPRSSAPSRTPPRTRTTTEAGPGGSACTRARFISLRGVRGGRSAGARGRPRGGARGGGARTEGGVGGAVVRLGKRVRGENQGRAALRTGVVDRERVARGTDSRARRRFLLKTRRHTRVRSPADALNSRRPKL